uniref:Uncharacterized protein n=2 Tax=Salix viminalis TaxID=40686 RepID=A0A6N2MEK2_SALVM
MKSPSEKKRCCHRHVLTNKFPKMIEPLVKIEQALGFLLLISGTIAAVNSGCFLSSFVIPNQTPVSCSEEHLLLLLVKEWLLVFEQYCETSLSTKHVHLLLRS